MTDKRTEGLLLSISKLDYICECGKPAILKVHTSTRLGRRTDNYCNDCIPDYVRGRWHHEGGKL